MIVRRYRHRPSNRRPAMRVYLTVIAGSRWPEIVLHGAQIGALVGQGIAAAAGQHMRVHVPEAGLRQPSQRGS